MLRGNRAKPVEEIAFESYGVRIVVSFQDPGLRDRIEALLPPAHWRCEPIDAVHRLGLAGDGAGGFDVIDDGDVVTGSAELDVAIGVLDAQLRMAVALGSRDRIFVHAGVVGHRGGAIVIPGRTFSGKTTLVAALVRAGAVYYSDEFAVLDDRGRVHPYPKPLSLRTPDGRPGPESPVERLGGVQGREPLRTRLILVTEYRPSAVWRPRRLSAGQGALALISNTLPARDRPADALAATRRAVEDALVLEGERGDVESIAAEVLGAADRGLDATSPTA